MDTYYGKWHVQLEKTSGLVELGQLFGWDEEKRKMFANLEYTMLLEPSGDKHRCLLDYIKFQIELFFKIGEEFEYTSPDGTKAMLTVTIEDGKLIENYKKDDGATWRTERILDGNTMHTVTTFGHYDGLKCEQHLVRA